MKLKRIILIMLCSIALMPLLAQQPTEVILVLDKYGKQQGSVLVHLAEDILSKGSNLTLYKSLIVDDISLDKKQEILDAVSSQTQKWATLSEVKKGGAIESASYYINRKEKNNAQYYLLIKSTNKKLTIIYIEGNFLIGDLQSELKKLKGLFIYVNEKRINIQ